jgi:hypothetical protein
VRRIIGLNFRGNGHWLSRTRHLRPSFGGALPTYVVGQRACRSWLRRRLSFGSSSSRHRSVATIPASTKSRTEPRRVGAQARITQSGERSVFLWRPISQKGNLPRLISDKAYEAGSSGGAAAPGQVDSPNLGLYRSPPEPITMFTARP